MKILMIAPEPFFHPRGTPISVYQRLLALASLNHQIDLLTYHLGEDVDIPGVLIHRIPAIPFIKSAKPGPSWAKLILDPLLIIYAIFMLITNRYDVIHSHEEASFFAAPLAKVFGLKHLYDMHSSLPKQLNNSNFWGNFFFVRIFKILEDMVLRSSDAIITIGSDLYDLVKQKHPESNTVEIENLPMQTISAASDHGKIESIKQNLGLNGRYTVVYSGTFETYQGLDMLIDSAGIAISECPEILFLLIGGRTGQINYYQNLISERNLRDFFRFTGNVSPAEVIAHLDLASVVVSPRLEGTSIPLKIYTYLLSGKPLVATNIAAHRMVLNEDLAVLAAPNPEEFAQAILKLFNNPQLGLHLAGRAQEFMREKNGFDTYQKRVAFIYQTMVTDQSAQVPAKASFENE